MKHMKMNYVKHKLKSDFEICNEVGLKICYEESYLPIIY